MTGRVLIRIKGCVLGVQRTTDPFHPYAETNLMYVDKYSKIQKMWKTVKKTIKDDRKMTVRDDKS